MTQRLRTWRTVTAGLVLLGLAGCAALDRVRPQALSPADDDLSSIEYRLVLLSVDIEQRDSDLRLDRLVAQNLDTEEFWVSVFFYNAVIGSQELPFTTNGDITEHLVFLDIPAGRYALTKVELARRVEAAGWISTRTIKGELPRGIGFEVADEQATYIGNLSAEIFRARDAAEATRPLTALGYPLSWDSAPGIRVAIRQGEDGPVTGWINYASGGMRQRDLDNARARYPALRDVEFSRRGLVIEP